MKRTTAAVVMSLCAVLVLQSIPANASESFTLNIPLRGNPQQETGEVRITLTLNAAPAGSHLVVNGNVTLNLGDTQTVAGDSVSFAAAGGNDVRITYKPLSNFSGDFCTGFAPAEKNVPMRFAGAQDVTEYRMSTYIVAAPAVDCSVVYKHTGDTPATLIPADDSVAPALTAANRGRHPIDLVLVLDKSGSMADFAPGTGASPDQPSKATILKSAMATFVSQWLEIDQPTMDGGEWSHDRIGVVFFDNVIAPQILPGADAPGNVFVQRGASIPGAWNAVINSINSLTPGGSTSIGGGINEGMKQWKLDPAHDLSVILVTDGIQNTAPLVQPAPSGFLGLPPISGFPEELRKRLIPIQTIGFGAPAAVDETLMKNISLETAGVSYKPISAITLYDDLGATLVALLKGNTASMAFVHHETLTGSGPSAPQPLIVDRSAQRLVVTVQWIPPLRAALDLEVFRPDGSAAAPDSAQKTPQSSMQMFNVKPGDIGTWSIRVKRGANKDIKSVPYTLNALILERHLDYRLSIDPARAATGDRLTVRAVVAWDGKPLAGLPAGALRVRIQRPPESLGTILHGTRFEERSTGTTTTPAGDKLTPYDRKLAALTRDGLLKRITPADFATIELKERSRGVYEGSFDQTSIAGSYGFEAMLDWNDGRTGHIRRVERLEEVVRVKPDPDRTEVKMTRVDARTVTIAVTPRDKSGNFLGPGYASLIHAKLNGEGRLAGPVDHDQTGTYVFTAAGLRPNEAPDVTITVDGVAIGARKP
jgi:hypothetical protein